MDNLTRLLENYANVEHRLDGRTLKPFCALHFLWLCHLKSPFVTSESGAHIGPAQVSLAALVCSSSSSEEILGKLARAQSQTRVARWKRFARSIWRHYRPRNLATELAAFVRYQGDFLSLPEYGSRESGDNSGGGNEKLPWIFTLVAGMIRQTGWSEQTVLTLPLGKLLWYYSAFGYLETGESNIISDKENAAIEAMLHLTGGVR